MEVEDKVEGLELADVEVEDEVDGFELESNELDLVDVEENDDNEAELPESGRKFHYLEKEEVPPQTLVELERLQKSML